MGSEVAAKVSHSPSGESISELQRKHRQDLESLTLMTRPFKTLQFFIFATTQYITRSLMYAFTKDGWLVHFCVLLVASVLLLINVDGPHEKHVQEFLRFFEFGLWWVALGVASSIGLGSGLHTFVLYLGPHIALFTIKAMQCGRVDLKSAPYDTIQLKKGPSWLDKSCSEFGPPLFVSSDSRVRIPLMSLLSQVQIEAVLWGLGTALGELPPYFISRAARMSGSKMEAMEELDSASKDDGFLSSFLTKSKRWLVSHSQHLNFFMILLLASVPNPLFDLAGIMCGQFGVPFWKFFMATLIGKAIIKTHLQTVFIISVCNNQLLELVENRFMWILSFIPGFSSILPELIIKLHNAKEKYMTAAPAPSGVKAAKPWNFSFAMVWNTVVWIMLLNFFAKIITASAQGHLKQQQEVELANMSGESISEAHPRDGE